MSPAANVQGWPGWDARSPLDGASVARPTAPQVDHGNRVGRQRCPEPGERRSSTAKHHPLLDLQIGRQPVGACREKNHLPFWAAVDRGLDGRGRVGTAVSVGGSVDGSADGRPAGNAPWDTRIPGRPPVGRNDVPCHCGRTLDRGAGAAGARGASRGEEGQRGEDSKTNAAARMHVRKSLPGPLADVEDRSGEPLASDDLDDPPRLGNSGDPSLEQEQNRIARGEHRDGDGIRDRRVQRDDESRLGGR